MIRADRRPSGCPSDFAFDRKLAGELGATEKDAIEEHVRGCARCGKRLAELSREKEDFAEGAPPLVLPPGRAPRRWLWGGGAVIAAAAAIVLFVRAPGDATRTKGRASSLGFYVSHGGVVRLGTTGERVQPGDALRFTTTTRAPRYLSIYSVDGVRHASVYYPQSREAALVSPGERVALPASTVLDDTLGDETLYAVFCERPFKIDPLLRVIAAAPDRVPAPPDECEVDVSRLQKQARAPE